jgi:hypothetical protein
MFDAGGNIVPLLDYFIRAPARPEPVTFDPARTAVMVIDMQHDFGSRGGMFGCLRRRI